MDLMQKKRKCKFTAQMKEASGAVGSVVQMCPWPSCCSRAGLSAAFTGTPGWWKGISPRVLLDP